VRSAVRAPRPTPPVARAPRPTTAPVAEALLVRPTQIPETAQPPRAGILTVPERPPAATAAPATTAAAPAAAPSENDRIRDVIRRYEKAQSTLDADLYVRIYPSVDRERIVRAFQSLSSQSVEFEIRRIQIDPSGTQARVEGFEKRAAVPRAGTEQRVTGERVIQLERRPEGWVIVRLN
jgi:hypothetical protein